MSEIEVLIEFKKNLVMFLDELIESFPQEGDLIVFRIFINDQAPIKDVVDAFNYNINKDDQNLRRMVKDKNEHFFLENDPFNLANETQESVNHFKTLWRSGKLDKEDKNVIWRWITTFVYLGDKFAQSKRA